MRVIGHIDHPYLKITVFKMDNRVSVKFENQGYEQTFKIGDDERLNTLEAIRHWVDPTLVNEVLGHLALMHQSSLAAFARAFPAEAGIAFEEII